MDYYEELGIQRNASVADIREAYKLGVRLLHPDLQSDRRLKHLAECQMRRLGDVVATLLKPQERARYDASLIGKTQPTYSLILPVDSRARIWHTAARHWFWILLASTTMGMGAWYGLTGGAETPPRSVVAESSAVPGEAVPLRRKPAPVKGKGVRLPASAVELPAVRPRAFQFPSTDSQERAWLATGPTAATPSEILNPAHATALLPLEAGAAYVSSIESEPRFGGRWLFAADADAGDRAGTYPARYVEFELREQNGRLAGDYRAVYSRLDRAITPEVAFRVHGQAPPGSTGSLQWESNGGAKGELELTLQSPNRMLLKWWTTQFGKQEALSSGTAALVRQRTE